jgi:hypothetical protein
MPLKPGTRVKVVKKLFPNSSGRIGMEGVCLYPEDNAFKTGSWLCRMEGTNYIFLPEELEPIIDRGEYERFMERVLKPVPLDEPVTA